MLVLLSLTRTPNAKTLKSPVSRLPGRLQAIANIDPF